MTEQELLNLQGDQVYFVYKEMACPCCGECKVQKGAFLALYNARLLADIPFIINSAYRCPQHNSEVGSVTENHIIGVAFDIRCIQSSIRFRVINALMCIGFDRYGIYKSYIHTDMHPDKQFSIWL